MVSTFFNSLDDFYLSRQNTTKNNTIILGAWDNYTVDKTVIIRKEIEEILASTTNHVYIFVYEKDIYKYHNCMNHLRCHVHTYDYLCMLMDLFRSEHPEPIWIYVDGGWEYPGIFNTSDIEYLFHNSQKHNLRIAITSGSFWEEMVPLINDTHIIAFVGNGFYYKESYYYQYYKKLKPDYAVSKLMDMQRLSPEQAALLEHKSSVNSVLVLDWSL